MVLQDSRVSNPPPPFQAAEPSTSVDTSHSLGLQQSMLQSGQAAFSPDNYSIPEFYGIQNTATTIASGGLSLPAQSTSGLIGLPKETPEDVQTRVNQVRGTWFNPQALIDNTSMWNPTPLFLDNSGSNSHSMAVLRNRVVGCPALAPAPRKPASVANTSIEDSQSFTAPRHLEPSTAKPALSRLASKPGTRSNDQHLIADVQALPISIPPPDSLVTPTITSEQSNPVHLSPRKATTQSRKRKAKRRRAHHSDDEIKANDSSSAEDSDDMLTIARQTKSGRQVNRPTFFAPSPEAKQSARQLSSPLGTTTTPSGAPAKRRRKVYRKNGKEINITCRRCQRGHSPATNMIVFCDECNDAWHQYCHDPPISKELIDDKEAEWFCRECRPESLRQRVTILKLRLPQRRNTALLETSAVPLVGGQRFTTDEQRGYLSSLSHAALVDILITLSKTNPTLPIFPENIKDLRPSSFVVTPSSTPNISLSNSQSVSAEKPKATEIGSQLTGAIIADPQNAGSHNANKQADDGSDDSGSEYEVEEHRLYPRSGNGFRLPPEEDDLGILLDDPACPTFSYKLHSYPQANVIRENAVIIKAAG